MSFTWVSFYEELANKLLEFRDQSKRKNLIEIIKGMDSEYINFFTKEKDPSKIIDIHPFAVYSIFNRYSKIDKKQKVLQYLKARLNLESSIPEDFDGIPSVNPQQSFWTMPWDGSYPIEEIEQNWYLFEIASAEKLDEERFIKAFDLVIQQNGAKWNVSQALFRAFPDRFLSLDENSRNYLIKHEIQVMKDKDFNGKSYLELSKLVKSKLDSKELKDGDFVSLSHNSWLAGNEAVNYWLLSWNQEKWNWETYENWCKQSKKGKSFNEDWRCSNSHAKKGDEFYIVKCGTGVKGIFAHGFLTSDSYMDNDNTRRVGIEFDYIINYKEEKILELDLLKTECPNQNWSPQSSGIEIKSENITKLKNLWNQLIIKENNMNPYVTLLETNKNLILHGAPGTGKTYTAKDIAAQMICGKTFSEIEPGSEEEKLFNDQTEFVQFHPSYDYSDFVEGLRPIEGETSGDVGFERKDGVFKEFCNRALKKNNVGGNDTFETAWNLFVDELNEKESIQIKTVNNKAQFTVRLNQNGDGLVDEQETYTRFYNYQQLYNVYRGLPGVPNRGHDNYRLAVINYLKEKHQLTDYKKGIESSNDGQKFIFIIDEINRGEMSKIFGELFYSIDPDYRGPKGKVRTQYANMLKETNDFDEALQITNSFGHFFVPENVYIIGTMNDIDRSIDSMDFAMRRRFTFVELKANECIDMLNNLQLSEGITKSDILAKMTVLNNEIEKISGLSSSYHIGGSYFAKLSKYSNKSKNEAFECLWNNHLKPLITDYLRGLPNMDAKLKFFKEKYDEAGNETSEESDN